MKPLLEMSNISYKYHTKTEDILVLNNFSFKLFPGESVALMGPSGSGKSTVLLLAGLIHFLQKGELFIDGEIAPKTQRHRAAMRNRLFGFVFQEYAVIEDLLVWENVALPLEYAPTRIPRRVLHQQAVVELEKYDIAELANRRVSELSGGQRQRVSIARATINNPKIILADEPTAALDKEACKKVIDILDTLRNTGRGIVIATHDSRVAKSCNRIVELR